MALDPRLVFNINNTPVTETFKNTLLNIGEQQRQAQSAELQPFRNQLLQAQAQSAGTAAVEQREAQRQKSLIDLSFQIKPFLDKGDTNSALQLLESRVEGLRRNNVPTGDSEELLNMVINNPIQAMDSVNAAVELGRQKGLLGGQQAQAPAGLREFQGLVEAAGLTPEGTQQAAKIRLGVEAKASNFRERLQFEINKQRDAGNIKVEQDLRKTASTLGIKLELDPKIAAKTEEAKLPALQRKETIKANTKRITFLSGDQRKRDSSIRKARQFLKPLQEGRAFSGAGRTAASFIPGVFTSQGQFDEKFNAFAEVAARQQLKASGEIRPTDADVEGMKRAMFGVGRDEQVNIELLQEFIQDQEAMNDELEDLTQSRSSGTLDTFDVQRQRQRSIQDIPSNELQNLTTEQLQQLLNQGQ